MKYCIALGLGTAFGLDNPNGKYVLHQEEVVTVSPKKCATHLVGKSNFYGLFLCIAKIMLYRIPMVS